MVHDDGDEEDMEEHELARARKYLDDDVQDMPEDEEEEEEDDNKDKDDDDDEVSLL